MSSSQLNKLKSGIKNGIKVILKIFSNVVGNSNEVSRLRKAFTNGSSSNIKLSKTQLHKIGQSGWFLGRLLGPLTKTGLLLIGNIIKLLAKSVLVPLGLTAAASATDAAIH